MPDLREQSGRDEMVDVLKSSELREGSKSENHPRDEQGKAAPSQKVRHVDLVWIHQAQAEPGDPQDTHDCEDESKNGLALRIDLTGVL